MKRSSGILAIILAMLLATNVNLQSQENVTWPKQSSWISGYIGFVGAFVPMGLNYDHLWHREKAHLGISSGFLISFETDSPNTLLGAYSAFVFLTGTGNNHFEGRLGASVHPFLVSPEWQTGGTEIPFMPVITIGYRYQPPGSREFFRLSFGTGGIGLGLGIQLGGRNPKGEG
jgi:hypothetical protein